MKSIDLKAGLRKDTGKESTKELRRNEMVPCVMYGGNETVHFSVSEGDFRHVIFTNDVFQVNLDIDGKKYKAVLQDTQYHPVSDKLLHADFIEISDDKPVVVSLPIEITGNSVGVRAGGKLRLRRRYLKVKGFLKDLPERLVVDITNLKIGSVTKVGDLSYPSIELLDPTQALVVGVAASRLAKGGEEGEEEGEAEGEATAEAAAEQPAEGAES